MAPARSRSVLLWHPEAGSNDQHAGYYAFADMSIEAACEFLYTCHS